MESSAVLTETMSCREALQRPSLLTSLLPTICYDLGFALYLSRPLLHSACWCSNAQGKIVSKSLQKVMANRHQIALRMDLRCPGFWSIHVLSCPPFCPRAPGPVAFSFQQCLVIFTKLPKSHACFWSDLELFSVRVARRRLPAFQMHSTHSELFTPYLRNRPFPWAATSFFYPQPEAEMRLQMRQTSSEMRLSLSTRFPSAVTARAIQHCRQVISLRGVLSWIFTRQLLILNHTFIKCLSFSPLRLWGYQYRACHKELQTASSLPLQKIKAPQRKWLGIQRDQQAI